MELIYLWTKRFKNLSGGYPLSSKYTITFDINNKELVVCKNKKHIENFFDDQNKINISAIIGENGSGKSSILKLIIQLLYNASNQESTQKIEESFLIMEINNHFYYVSTGWEVFHALKFRYKHQKLRPYDNNFYALYFNYMLDSLKDNAAEDWIDNIYHKSDDYAMPILLEPYKRNNNIDINNLNYLTRQRMILHRSSFKNNKFLNDIFNPEKVKISVDTDKIVKIYESTLDGKYTPGIKESYKKEFSTLNKMLQQIEQEKRNIESIKKRFKENTKKLYDLEVESLDNIQKYQNEIKKNILNNIPFYALNNLYIANKIDKYQKYRRTPSLPSGVDGYSFNKSENKINIIIEDESHNTLKLRNAEEYQKFILNNIDINYSERESYISIDDERLKYLPSWFEVNFFDENERTFTTLSAGEKSFYILLTTLIYQINNITSRKNLNHGTYTNMLIMLDEADLGLHPKWQRKYLYNIIETLKQSSPVLNYHLICTSHSPFIVSDLPKDNILFLYNGKVDNLKESEYTFGENIHTLLNDSFFMQKDMMMGQIAENKIKDAFEFFEKVFECNEKINQILKEKEDNRIDDNDKKYRQKSEELDNLHKLKKEYIENYKYFVNLNNIIGEEYIRLAFKNGIKECDEIFDINQKDDDKNKILKALENNPDLASKWLKDIK